MPTCTARRTEKSLTHRWLSRDVRELFACGLSATLAIDADDADDVAGMDHYAVECVLSADRSRVTGWTVSKLRQDGEVESYHLPGNLSRCQCHHSRYRPHGKPCRHRLSLHAALTEIGFTLPPPK